MSRLTILIRLTVADIIVIGKLISLKGRQNCNILLVFERLFFVIKFPNDKTDSDKGLWDTTVLCYKCLLL